MEIEKADEFKTLGNKEFKAANFTKAIEYYTKAISTSPFLCILLKKIHELFF